MDRKIIGMGIGAMLVIGLFTIMGFAFAQENETEQVIADENVCPNAANCQNKASGFVDTDGDGVCDNAATCQTAKAGCSGGCGKRLAAGRCPRMS